MRNVVITRSNRGLGLEFVKQMLALPNPPENIFATCRDPAGAADLNKLTSESKKTKIHVEKLDVSDLSQLSPLVAKVKAVVGAQGVNLLVNNSGVMDLSGMKLQQLQPAAFLQSYQVNTLGPVFCVKITRYIVYRYF